MSNDAGRASGRGRRGCVPVTDQRVSHGWFRCCRRCCHPCCRRRGSFSISISTSTHIHPSSCLTGCSRTVCTPAGEDELDGSTCRPSVSRAGVETKDDIKFIWNGRVLGTTEELQEVCLQYFGSVENTSRPAGGRGGTTNPDADAANKVLILHAVVRPPMAPGKRKGKGVEGAAGGSQGRGQQQGDGVCSCCVIS
jgi:hypothetical protein